jgi:hypothetical protein
MARRKGTTKRYTKAQKQVVLKRVQAGETQAAVAAATGVPLATVGYWTRKAKGAGTTANGAARPKAKRGRLTGPRNRPTAATSTAKSGGIAWALDGDVLVIRTARVRAADRGRGAGEDLTNQPTRWEVHRCADH